MLRLGLLLVIVTTGCSFDENGIKEVCFHPACDDGDEGPRVPPAPPHPISFSFDRGPRFASRLAAGGVLDLRVEARPSQIATVTASDLFDLTVTSEAPHLTTIELVGLTAGDGTLTATIPTFSEPAVLALDVAEIDHVALDVDYPTQHEELLVLTDIREVGVQLIASDGAPLIDHSLALDATSDPGFALTSWNALSITAMPGDYLVAFTRRAADLHHFPVRVLDRVDAIVADTFDVGVPSGTLCVHAEAEGHRVATRAYTFAGNDKLLIGGGNDRCIEFFSAQPGAAITVEVGGISTAFQVLAAPM